MLDTARVVRAPPAERGVTSARPIARAQRLPRQRLGSCAAGLALAVLCAPLCSPARAADAGSVVFATGPVVITSDGGKASRASPGHPLAGGTLLRTGPGGRVQVRLRDGTYLSVSSSTDMRIDAYRYGAAHGAGDLASFTLFRGKVRFMTGTIGRASGSRFRLNTPVAAVDAYAGEFVATAASGLELSVGSGRVELRNEVGSLVLASGQRAFVRERNTAPVLIGTVVPAPIVPDAR